MQYRFQFITEKTNFRLPKFLWNCFPNFRKLENLVMERNKSLDMHCEYIINNEINNQQNNTQSVDKTSYCLLKNLLNNAKEENSVFGLNNNNDSNNKKLNKKTILVENIKMFYIQ
jgi:hypothetical protein